MRFTTVLFYAGALLTAAAFVLLEREADDASAVADKLFRAS